MTLIVDGTAGITFPSGSGTQAAQSKVLQMVNATYATQTSNTTTTYADTGLTATITPLFSTSKILVQANLPSRASSGSVYGIAFQLVRNGTGVFSPMSNVFYRDTATNNMSALVPVLYLDSPASTSALTYKIQFKIGGGGTGNVLTQIDNDTSYIVLTEIAQ